MNQVQIVTHCVSMREFLPGISWGNVYVFPNPEKNQSKNRENNERTAILLWQTRMK
jgi:hypothetical protein